MSFLCSSCSITFNNEEEYKCHYKTDLHRYNVKRRMLNLESISNEHFLEKKES